MAYCAEACLSILRALENLPGIGHMIAMCYACAGNKDKAERAGIKASVGICFALCNCPIEMLDECVRDRSEKLRHRSIQPRVDWMKNHQHRTISQITLPGSHQSGTAHMEKKLKAVPMCEGWSRCQEINIYDQLCAGIRFLDLRLMNHENDIWLHHNIVICVKFKNVLLDVQRFIKDHPTEIIGIYLTADGKPLDWALCDSYIMEVLKNRLIFEHQKDMLIGDLIDQGKNVIIFGMPHKPYSWLCLEYRWPNKVWPRELKQDMIETLADMEDRSSTDLFWYKAECTPNGAMVTRSIGGVPGAAAFRRADEKLEFIRDLAASANQVVSDILNEIGTLPFWVLSTDYVQDDVIARIVTLNERAQSAVAPLDVTSGTDRESAYTDSHMNYSLISSEAPLYRNSKTIHVRETGL